MIYRGGQTSVFDHRLISFPSLLDTILLGKTTVEVNGVDPRQRLAFLEAGGQCSSGGRSRLNADGIEASS